MWINAGSLKGKQEIYLNRFDLSGAIYYNSPQPEQFGELLSSCDYQGKELIVM